MKIAARALATYLIPGCVGRGVRLGSENSSGGAGAGGVWKSGIWRSGYLEIQKFGDLGTRKSRNVGSKQTKKVNNLKIQIRSAQNVGKIWISGEKILLGLFGAI